MNLVGIDCAVDPKKCGLAIGESTKNGIIIEYVATGLREEELLESICCSINNNSTTLLAIDAPFGWPVSLEESLQGHKAGDVIAQDSNTLFRRETDRFIKKHINKQPLDVGADRIARTAWAALRLLDKIRIKTRLEVPVAWRPGSVVDTSCIEVYPAATLEAWQLSPVGYKGKDEEKATARLQLLDRLRDVIKVNENQQRIMLKSDDAFDAVLCLLAAQDFTQCSAYNPPDLAVAEREGWIWVRKPNKD